MPAFFGNSLPMRRTILALLPIVAWRAWASDGFGILLLVTVASCFFCEMLCRLLRERQWSAARVVDESSLIVAMILALSLPATISPTVGFAAAAFAIIVAKQAYGGLGNNIFNPAMAGYVFVFLAFPESMIYPAPDGVTAPSLIVGGDAPTISSRDEAIPQGIAQGMVLAGGLWLITCRVADIFLALPFLCVVFLAGWAVDGAPLAHLLFGGTLLIAFFVVTDPVTSPRTATGRVIFAALAGMLIVLGRRYTIHQDIAAFCILFCNMLSPLLDRIVAKDD